MASSTEPKSLENQGNETEATYSVEEEEEDDTSETDHFSRMKPKLLHTPSILNAIIDQIHPDVISKSHQSNFVLFPPKLEGCTVVDLGCGVGRDVFILSKLVREHGHLQFARDHIDYHIKKFGLSKVNIEFINGEIDQLEKTKLKENSIDVVVSNSVVNYKRDKKAIIEGACKILKPGGEFYFSDVYVNRPIPVEHQEVLSGEYIGGALRWEDLILYATEAGFTQPRLVTAKPYVIANEEIQKAIGKTKFVSAIFRCFKLPLVETDTSLFNIPYQLTYETPLVSAEDEFFFDHALQFKLGELLVIDDPSIAFALSLSRYKDNFTFDPITEPQTVTVVETIEETPTGLFIRELRILTKAQTSNDNNTGEVYRKTTTITTTTIVPNE
ncbi:hypothetical protein I4U23_002846 [Adineta vaga]|nr:hypothetical protein I4U23_002846 [Adineta vaga]